MEEGLRLVADGVTTISTVLRDRAIEVGVPSERVRVIPSGADIDGIRPGDKAAARRSLGLPADARILGFAGFVDQDIDVVLGAVARLRGRFPQVKAMIVGMSDFARRTAVELGITDHVILPGVRPYRELSDYFAAADVLALPLRDTLFNRARWPNKLGDYLAAGRPTVTNPVGDIRFLFEQHEIGFLARPDDVDDFAAQVARLLADDDLADRMGSSARRLGEGDYSWHCMTDSLEEFYHLTLSRFHACNRR